MVRSFSLRAHGKCCLLFAQSAVAKRRLLKAEIPKAALPMFLRAIELGHARPERCRNGAALAYLQDNRPRCVLCSVLRVLLY